MAHVRDSDTSLWLHNKLGTSNDLWLGGSICSQLNQDVLRNIRECFIELQSQVKLKLLLSFLHIPRRNVEEWKVELEEILEVALADSDQWVSMLAELLKSYPSSGVLNFQIEENASVFTDLVADLKKLVRKHSDQGILPMECLYLNRNALNAVVGQLPQPIKHFTLKQKPKSATLRAELLQKSNDAASNLRKSSSAPSVPIRCRRLIKPLNDTTPLKGIPNRLPGGFKSPSTGLNRLHSSTLQSKSFARPPSGRKDGGIKFLEIDEQPIGYGREAKRRKKQPEAEIPDQKKEKEGIPLAQPSTPTTPDYAAGLLSSSQLSGPSISVIASSPGNQSYAPSTPGTSLPTAVGGTTTLPVTVLTTAPSKPRESFQQSLGTVDVSLVQSPNAQSQSVQEQPSTLTHTTTIGNIASMGGASVQVQVQHLPAQPQQTAPTPQPQPQPAQPQKKGLSLSREQMQEAQEMFKNSNKVTRPEKALILGFMAGSRENPCPHLGNIVTIKLSENEENVLQGDGTVQPMIVETHFQMNYSTGEWKRVKKCRKLEE